MRRFRRISILEGDTLLGAYEYYPMTDPDTGEISIACDNGCSYQCQQDIDLEKPIAWLIAEGL